MDPDAEQALLQLQAEELAVGYAQGCTACATEVRWQEWLRVVPGACASLKLPHVVIVGTCVKVSDNINTGSYGDCSIDKGGTGWNAQVLIVKVDPPLKLVMIELRLAGDHLAALDVLSTSDASKYIQLHGNTTGHCSKPPLFQWAYGSPLLGPWIVALHRLEQLPIGASAHGIDFLFHSCIAANLPNHGQVRLLRPGF